MNPNPMGAAGNTYETMFAEIANESARWEQPAPPFTFEFGWATQYERLFLDEYEERSSIDGVLAKATASGRVLITAKGGAAKTTVVKGLIRAVVGTREGLPVFISIQRWRAQFYEKWQALPEGWIARLNFILQELGLPQTSTAALDAISTGQVVTLFVDGLNEVSSAVAQDLLVALDEFVSRTAHARVIITDRLVRRTLPTRTAWHLGTVLPLDPDQVRGHLLHYLGSDDAWAHASDADREVLRIPFFLNQRLHSIGAPASRAATFQQYFASHALREQQLDDAGRAAFHMYRDDRSRTFPVAEFRKFAGDEITEKLVQAGTLTVSGDLACFWHQLDHDYLASRHLVAHPELWDPTTLDRVTFGASSFDILSLTLEQLPSPGVVDRFLTVTYDWNLYGTAYALADAYASAVSVDREIETVIVAMLADRRWDLILATVQRARDALALFPAASPARQMLSMNSRSELLTWVATMQGAHSWFVEWQSLFTTAEQSRVSDDVISKVLDEHSIVGWTTANVLRRARLDDREQELLRSWVNEEGRTATVVWRIAHALGTHANESNRDLLVTLLASPHYWVQYGAVRSLVECAAYGNSRLRKSIFEQLRRKLRDLPTGVIAEFEQAVLIDPERAPRDWGELAIPIIRELYKEGQSENDRIRTQNTVQKLKVEYRRII